MIFIYYKNFSKVNFIKNLIVFKCSLRNVRFYKENKNMNMEKQDILKSKTYQKYVKKKNITQATLNTYVFALLQLCKANNKELDHMVKEILEEQLPYIDEHGRIHEYNPEFSKIDDYLNNTADYLREKGNSNNSIQSILIRIRAVMNSLNIKLPKPIELENDEKDWNVLTKEDIKFVNSISPLNYQALFTFMAHTGIRTGDVINMFTIESFMKATEEYHNCTELDDFLENAPDDMVGYWEFIPKKTRKHNVECKVYNTAESSNLILRSLHMRKESIRRINEKNNTSLHLEKTDALFSSRVKNFKGKLTENAVTNMCHRKNKALREYNERKLYQKYEEGTISKDTLMVKLDEIPIFHAHGLRKFFITTLSIKRVDIRASALLEGHSPIMQDKSYVDSDKLDNLLWEEYQRVIPALSLEKDEEDFTMGKRNKELEIENLQLKEQAELLRSENSQIRNTIDRQVEDKIEEVLNRYGF